jgi:hypothetical protein
VYPLARRANLTSTRFLAFQTRGKPLPTWQGGSCLVSRLIVPVCFTCSLDLTSQDKAMQCNVRHDTTRPGKGSFRGNSPVMKMKVSNPFSPVGSLSYSILLCSKKKRKRRDQARPGARSSTRVGCTGTNKPEQINRLTTDRVHGNNCNWKETGHSF